MSAALEIRNLHKRYKGFALESISFAVPAGPIMGLVGPNGAGKTTIIKLILNLVRRDGGEIKVFGRELLDHEKEIKSRIGFVHETPAFIEDAHLKDIAAAVAPFYRKWDSSRFRSLAAEFGLPLDKKFKTLSHGTKMKFSLALALAHDADLLILDEPTSGLDPVFRLDLLEKLSGIIQDEGKAVLFSTYITSDLEKTADYITLIHGGEVVFSLPKDEVHNSWAVVKGGPDLLTPAYRPLFRTVRETPYGIEALTSDAGAVRKAVPQGVIIDRASIEDIMLFCEEGGRHA